MSLACLRRTRIVMRYIPDGVLLLKLVLFCVNFKKEMKSYIEYGSLMHDRIIRRDELGEGKKTTSWRSHTQLYKKQQTDKMPKTYQKIKRRENFVTLFPQNLNRH